MTQPPENQSTPKSSGAVRTTKWVVIGLCLAAVGAGLIYPSPQLAGILVPASSLIN